MKILQITPRVPYPLNDGGRIGIFNITKYLALRGHKITLVSLWEPGTSLSEQEKNVLNEYCAPFFIEKNTKTTLTGFLKNQFENLPYNIKKYHSEQIYNKIKAIANEIKPDIIHIDHLHMAWYGIRLKKELGIPCILREHNVESTIMERFYKSQSNVVKKFLLGIQHSKLYRYESNTTKLFERCIMITPVDEARIKFMNPAVKTAVIPAGVDTVSLQPKEDHLTINGRIIQVGSMEWLPNIQGMHWFLKYVYPLVKRKVKESELWIVGKINPKDKKIFSQYDDVRVTGFVDDIDKIMENSQVYIVPLLTGGGMRIKILEAMAYGKAIVSTSVGAEGIEVENGRDILIEDDPYKFAEAIVKLITNSAERKKLGFNARNLVEKKYSWPAIAKKFEEVYFEVIKNSGEPIV